MVQIFAFCAGLYYELPLGYFLLGGLLVLVECIISSANNKY